MGTDTFDMFQTVICNVLALLATDRLVVMLVVTSCVWHRADYVLHVTEQWTTLCPNHDMQSKLISSYFDSPFSPLIDRQVNVTAARWQSSLCKPH